MKPVKAWAYVNRDSNELEPGRVIVSLRTRREVIEAHGIISIEKLVRVEIREVKKRRKR